jgi:hypothetical protein
MIMLYAALVVSYKVGVAESADGRPVRQSFTGVVGGCSSLVTLFRHRDSIAKLQWYE